jgi:hypothetical protein
MHFVIFAAPWFSEDATRFIEATLNQQGVRLAVVSQDRQEHPASHLRDRLAAHWRVEDIFDPVQLSHAARQLSNRFVPIHRLFGAYEQLQVPLAEARAGKRAGRGYPRARTGRAGVGRAGDGREAPAGRTDFHGQLRGRGLRPTAPPGDSRRQGCSAPSHQHRPSRAWLTLRLRRMLTAGSRVRQIRSTVEGEEEASCTS